LTAEEVVVSRETLARLQLFTDLLREWTKKINLISPKDLDVLWRRHIQDSLQLAPLITPDAQHIIDLGSGAGFPGIPLALATGLHFDLVEADHRKAAFLREAVRVTRAPATVHVARAEHVTLDNASVLTARGFAPLPRLLPLAARLLANDGVCILPKGSAIERELTDASKQWHMQIERFPSRIDPSGVILRISHLRRV